MRWLLRQVTQAALASSPGKIGSSSPMHKSNNPCYTGQALSCLFTNGSTEVSDTREGSEDQVLGVDGNPCI